MSDSRKAFEAGFRAALALCPPRLVPAGPPRVWYTHYDGNAGPRGRQRHVDIGSLVIKDPADEIEAAWQREQSRDGS